MAQEYTHWKKLKNPDYVGSYSLVDSQTGKYFDKVVTITSLTRAKVFGEDGKAKECMIANLSNEKPLIVNSTNAKVLTKLFNSPIIENWIGKSIIIYVATLRFFGENVDCIRIRPTLPTLPTLPELTPEHEKWLGAKEALLAGKTTIEAIKKAYIISIDNEAKLLNK